MDIQILTDGAHAQHQLDGSVLTLTLGESRLSLDLAAEQADATHVIEIRTDRAGQALSQSEGDTYAALITLPPRRYSVPDPETDADGAPLTPVAAPLDTAAVTLQLWGIARPETDTTGA